MRLDRYVHVQDSCVYASPNVAQLPLSGPAFDEEPGKHMTVQQLRNLNWSDNKRPYLPYMLTRNIFSSPFLSRLNFTFSNLPLERLDSGWCLAPTILESWSRLEQTLYLMQEILIQHSGHFFPVDFTYWWLPSTFPLHKTQLSERYARKIAIRARDAFLPLIALCTYALCLYTRPTDEVIQRTWYDVLIQGGMHPPSVDAIRDSEIARFDLPRTGVIIDAVRCVWPNDIHRIVKSNGPVLIFWGTTHQLNITTNVGLTRYKPSSAQIREAVAISESRWSMEEKSYWEPKLSSLVSVSSSTPLPSSESSAGYTPRPAPDNSEHTSASLSTKAKTFPPVSDFPVLPQPEPHSGQKAGESWRQFLDRCQMIIAVKLKKDTPQQKQRRESLLRASKHGPVKSSTVYAWQKDYDTNFRIRTRIFKASSYDTWKSYRAGHRRFDAVFNEWDLCSEFGDPTENHQTAPDSDDDDNFPQDVSPPHKRSAPSDLERRNKILNLIKTSRDILEKDVNDVYGSNEIETTLSVPLIYFEHALEKRYGFSPPSPLNDPIPGFDFGQLDDLSEKQWVVLCKRYVQQPQRADIPNYTRSLIQYFTTTIASMDFTDPQPSHHVWDVRSSHLKSIHAEMLMSPVGIQRVEIDDRTLYELKLNDQPSHLNVEWHLLVPDALTALQCIREGWGPSLEDIAINLASIGANFHIFKTPHNPRLRDPFFLHPLVLGYRNKNYMPTTGDYLQYVEIRNSLLQESRCRAALTRGGILWRLAMEALDPTSVIDFVFSQNERIVHYPTPSDECWETALTEADENIICGVYFVYTGKGNQTSQVSWWPKQNVWARKGLSTGYWTAECEEWYQFGLKAILEGKSPLRNSHEWAQALGFQKNRTRGMIENHENAAKMLLDNQYFP